MLNKPAGVLSAVSDNNCKTVIDLLNVRLKKDFFLLEDLIRTQKAYFL